MNVRDSFLYEMRLQFMSSAPRLVERPRHEHDRRMEQYWIEMAHATRRPRYVWLAMKSAWWSGWNEAVGTTYKTTPPGQRSRAHSVLTGITS